MTQGGTTTESYSYDPVGNRTASLGIPSYTTNSSNEMTANSNASYTYDSNGNTHTKTDSSGTTTYAWDYENRLTSVTLPGSAGTVTFKYDPFGRRIEKISPPTTSIFAYDGDNLIEEANGSGSEVASYTQSENIDEPLAMNRGGTVDYYEQDGLGSVTSLTNSAGSVAQTYTYNSFGNQTASSGSLTNFFRYTGREFDAETGLYFYRARDYDANAGRFLSEDPAGFIDGPNRYLYTLNDPILLTDPTGLYSWDEFVQDTVNFTAGAGDTLSLGLSAYARDQWGDFFYPQIPPVVKKCSGAYSLGVVTGTAIGLAIADELAAKPNDTQIKVAMHEAHHTFGALGKLPHIQINVWQAGISGSGWALRIPLPW